MEALIAQAERNPRKPRIGGPEGQPMGGTDYLLARLGEGFSLPSKQDKSSWEHNLRRRRQRVGIPKEPDASRKTLKAKLTELIAAGLFGLPDV